MKIVVEITARTVRAEAVTKDGKTFPRQLAIRPDQDDDNPDGIRVLVEIAVAGVLRDAQTALLTA